MCRHMIRNGEAPSMRAAATRTALIEKDDAVGVWIEEPAVVGDQSGAGTTMKKQNRLSIRRAALFVIKLVNSGHSDVPAVVGFQLRIKVS